jgi:hypothetical protein
MFLCRNGIKIIKNTPFLIRKYAPIIIFNLLASTN